MTSVRSAANMVNLSRFIRHQTKRTEQINLFMTPRPQDAACQRVKRDTGGSKAVGLVSSLVILDVYVQFMTGFH